MQVDPHLTRYIEELKLRDGATVEDMHSTAQQQAPTALAQLQQSQLAPQQDVPSSSALMDSQHAAEGLPLPCAVLNKGVLHNELPSPMPSPRGKSASAAAVSYIFCIVLLLLQ